MKIQLITIDFWNTLFDSSNGIKRNAVRQHVFAEEIAKLDVKVSHDKFSEAVQASWEFFNNIWMNQQRTPETIETIGYLWSYLNLPHNDNSIQRVAKSFAESILDYPPSLMENSFETLSNLKSRGYKLGLISDTGFTPGSILKMVMQNAGVLDLFDAFSFSDETGVSKPHEKAYTTILDQLSIEPMNSLHIGDIEKTDIVGAKKVGMRAIRFSGDQTAVLNKDNNKITLADSEIFNWNEFESTLVEIENSI
ncbi:HAD family hydrolase [Candidatus Kapaibacterium sp.]